MLILTIRTDKPDAEIGLYQDQKQLEYIQWYAHRELSITLHNQILALLSKQDKNLQDVAGLVVFRGPGSFTGLRIGISVANALADGLVLPIIGSWGEDWIEAGIQNLIVGKNDRIIVPEYGSAPHITVQKK